ncbi:hypothetical protein BJ170DRAFT_717186 [Xylariales sp. AK1849]|nr:hypothetical protein BJ170DRAFT_717186 [Xylariales sp. AK1849]
MGTSSSTGEISRKSDIGRGKQPHPDNGADGVEEAEYNQTLSILVFKGHPVDLQNTRRADFCMVANDDKSTNTTFRLEGGGGSYWVRQSPNLGVPHTRDHFLREFHVATVQATSASDRRLRDAVLRAQPKNNEPDWNCLSWVGDVIDELHGAGLILAGEAAHAVDCTIDEILRAPWQ